MTHTKVTPLTPLTTMLDTSDSIVDSQELCDTTPDTGEQEDLMQSDEAPPTASFDQNAVQQLDHREIQQYEQAVEEDQDNTLHNHVQKSTQATPSRVARPPIWLSDYVTSIKPRAHSSYFISQYVAYSHLSSSYQDYLGSFLVPT